METLRDEMTELFLTFLPGEVGSRFSTLLALEQKRWRKIDPWRTWRYVDSQSVVEWKGSADELLTASPASNYASAKVTVLRCGHDAPSLERLTLREALVGKSAVFEGFVSIVPRKLGVAINHDGMLCVLSKNSTEPLQPIARKSRSG
jgi:hypothetical protein